MIPLPSRSKAESVYSTSQAGNAGQRGFDVGLLQRLATTSGQVTPSARPPRQVDSDADDHRSCRSCAAQVRPEGHECAPTGGAAVQQPWARAGMHVRSANETRRHWSRSGTMKAVTVVSTRSVTICRCRAPNQVDEIGEAIGDPPAPARGSFPVASAVPAISSVSSGRVAASGGNARLGQRQRRLAAHRVAGPLLALPAGVPHALRYGGGSARERPARAPVPSRAAIRPSAARPAGHLLPVPPCRGNGLSRAPPYLRRSARR